MRVAASTVIVTTDLTQTSAGNNASSLVPEVDGVVVGVIVVLLPFAVSSVAGTALVVDSLPVVTEEVDGRDVISSLLRVVDDGCAAAGDAELRGVDPDVVDLSVRVTSSLLPVSLVLLDVECSVSVVVVDVVAVVSLTTVDVTLVAAVLSPARIPAASFSFSMLCNMYLIISGTGTVFDGSGAVVPADWLMRTVVVSVVVVEVIVGILLPVDPVFSLDRVAVVATELLVVADVDEDLKIKPVRRLQ